MWCGVLLTRFWLFLHRFNIVNSPTCVFCGRQPETLGHLFLHCVIVRPIWKQIKPQLCRLAGGHFDLTEDLIFYFQWPSFVPEKAKAPLTVTFSELIYSIWLKRAEVVFRDCCVDTRSVAVLFMHRLRTRIKADFSRLARQDFVDLWCRADILAKVVNDNLLIYI